MANNENIHLAKDGGLSPHLMKCPRCGKDNGEISIGAIIQGIDDDGNKHYTSKSMGSTYNKNNGLHLRWREVDSDEHINMFGGLCDTCKTETKEHHKIVAAGGLYFKCTECHCDGVIKSNEFTAMVREEQNKPAPELLGITFEKCEQHGG